MIGIDKIVFEHQDNGDIKIKFLNGIRPHILAIYKKLGVEPSFSSEMPLEITLTREEYYNTFIKPFSEPV